MFSFGGTPNKIGFIEGLDINTKLLNTSANEMLTALQAEDEITVRQKAEDMLNTIVGIQSPDHKDWGSDGDIDDSSDGYGLLLNGKNLGYIQGAFTHANLSLTSPDANANMLAHGEQVKTIMTNLGEWTPELRDVLISIINAPSGSDLESNVRQAIALTDQIRNGVDTNGNKEIEPISGEGGVVTAYQYAYYMADISITP
ncbi:MAG: hypothetical protein ABI986_08655 [Chloroflexota bacterium]